MQALAFGLAGCMAMDLLHILKKGRHDFKGLRADLTGARAETEPRRFTKIDLHYTITGDGAGRSGAARDRPVAREVLLGVALDAAGHRLLDHVQGLTGRLTREPCAEAISTGCAASPC